MDDVVGVQEGDAAGNVERNPLALPPPRHPLLAARCQRLPQVAPLPNQFLQFCERFGDLLLSGACSPAETPLALSRLKRQINLIALPTLFRGVMYPHLRKKQQAVQK